mmetsp:Transcript_24469/g.43877  ORF Transcript_24469/g.43877 Transcript_24469/m.43877 type:complete len:130 (-) Transcript_24469:551-940(-)
MTSNENKMYAKAIAAFVLFSILICLIWFDDSIRRTFAKLFRLIGCSGWAENIVAPVPSSPDEDEGKMNNSLNTLSLVRLYFMVFHFTVFNALHYLWRTVKSTPSSPCLALCVIIPGITKRAYGATPQKS